jgi:hypothetical protein
MPEHHPLNVKQVLAWCAVCNRRTMHRVDHKRLGSCTEPHVAEGLSRVQEKRREKQEQERQQPSLEGILK